VYAELSVKASIPNASRSGRLSSETSNVCPGAVSTSATVDTATVPYPGPQRRHAGPPATSGLSDLSAPTRTGARR